MNESIGVILVIMGKVVKAQAKFIPTCQLKHRSGKLKAIAVKLNGFDGRLVSPVFIMKMVFGEIIFILRQQRKCLQQKQKEKGCFGFQEMFPGFISAKSAIFIEIAFLFNDRKTAIINLLLLFAAQFGASSNFSLKKFVAIGKFIILAALRKEYI